MLQNTRAPETLPAGSTPAFATKSISGKGARPETTARIQKKRKEKAMEETREKVVAEETAETTEKTPQMQQTQGSTPQVTVSPTVKTMDKNIHTWVFCFLLGGFGVDRFVRGQIACGVCKLLFGWLTAGVWATVDWIIAMVKAYGSAFKDDRDFTFVNGKYSR